MVLVARADTATREDETNRSCPCHAVQMQRERSLLCCYAAYVCNLRTDLHARERERGRFFVCVGVH